MHCMKNGNFLGMIWRFLTSFAIAVILHAILLMHITFCTHKSQALEDNNKVIVLNLSIESQIAGNQDIIKIPKRLQEAKGSKLRISDKVGILNNKTLNNEILKSNSSKVIQKKEDSKKLSFKGGNVSILPVIFSPKFLHYTPPVYPKASRRKGQQGLVVVDVKLDEFGNQSPAFVHLSSGYKLLDAAALDAANQSVLQPAIGQFQEEGKNNINEACIARIKYLFKLKR